MVKEKENGYLIPPTSISTSAAAILFATENDLESTIFTVPPNFFSGTTFENANVNGCGVLLGTTISSLMFSGGGVPNYNVVMSCEKKKGVV